jgi:hypothetical protein
MKYDEIQTAIHTAKDAEINISSIVQTVEMYLDMMMEPKVTMETTIVMTAEWTTSMSALNVEKLVR